MNPTIETLLTNFYQRGLTTREQVLNEMLRIKVTNAAGESENHNETCQDADKLFQIMKEKTEQDLGFFPGDCDFFARQFNAGKDVDLIEFTLEIYKNDRLGIIIAPEYLTEFLYQYIEEKQPQTMLITEAEKHLVGMKGLLQKFPQIDFTFTTSYPQMYLLLTLGFQGFPNVKVIQQSIYQELLLDQKFDLIYCLPEFGGKSDEDIQTKTITNQTDGIAMENMLKILKGRGTLIAIVPARITFAGGSFAELRSYITHHFNVDNIFILPEGTFRPYTAIKTYMFYISGEIKKAVNIGTIRFEQDRFILSDSKSIPRESFVSHEDWRIEMILADDDANLQKYKASSVTKVKLKEIAEIFRGKSILKKDVAPGKISVLNISNIEDGEIHYEDMDSIDDEERKIKRYELIDGDVVLTCRGTSVKVAVFKQQSNMVIASANVIVIRSNTGMLGEYLKMFLESPIGTTLIKSFGRGTTMMNINHMDIAEIEIPARSLNEQQAMVDEYHQEFSLYKETIRKAETRWNGSKNKLYERMY